MTILKNDGCENRSAGTLQFESIRDLLFWDKTNSRNYVPVDLHTTAAEEDILIFFNVTLVLGFFHRDQMMIPNPNEKKKK